MWFRELLKASTYYHIDEPGLTYNIMLDGSLCNDVITKIIYYMLAQCNMIGEIANMRYHRVNKNSSSQEKMNLVLIFRLVKVKLPS